MNKPHRHATLIHTWADGAEIEYLNHCGSWEHLESPAWDEDTEYRIKPEKEYPKSTLTYDDLCKLVNLALAEHREDGTHEGYQTFLARYVANEAVKRYIKENEQ
jgi:hypothetical protein